MIAANSFPLSLYLFGREHIDANCRNGLTMMEATGMKHEGNEKEGVKNNQHGNGKQGQVEGCLEQRDRLDF